MHVLWEKLTAVRLHRNVASGGGADRHVPPQEHSLRWRRGLRTAVYESILWEREDRCASPRRTAAPTYQRGGEGGFGGANGVEGGRGEGGLGNIWPKGG